MAKGPNDDRPPSPWLYLACGGADGGTRRSADRRANERIEARDRAQQRTATGADCRSAENTIAAMGGAAAHGDAGD